MEPTFWDKDGFLHSEFYYDSDMGDFAPRPSENISLITIVCSLLSGSVIDIQLGYLYRNGYWHPCVDDSFPAEGFSHDNMTALVTYGLVNNKPSLAEQGWKHLLRQPYLHPRDIVYYAYGARKWWSYLLIWIPILCSILALAEKEGYSGKQLAWLRFKGMGFNWLIKKNWLTFRDTFYGFYWFGNHPIPELFDRSKA